MKKKLIMLVLAAMAAVGVTLAQTVKVVPQPSDIVPAKGKAWTATAFTVEVTDPGLVRTAEIFADQIVKIVPVKPEIVEVSTDLMISRTPEARFVRLLLDNVTIEMSRNRMGDEEYTLAVDEHGITITGGSAAGVFWGLQTLKQLLVSNAEWKTQNSVKTAAFTVPAMTIYDRPTFGYRGAMLDVCRHFADVHDVKGFIDMLAMHKINTFHWHLTDDQGWRIQIKSHPKLTSEGSVRTGTLIGHGGRQPFVYDDKPYAGCYTHDDVREVVKYAAERHITVIPEIEMPGHAQAALHAYPELGCTGGPYEVWRRWGVSPEVFCAGNDAVYELLEDVLAEVIELFPSKIIHIGGDECPKDRWKECPKCQARMKQEGLADEHELQSYFIQRMERWLNERGRTILGWDEILEGGLSKNAIVMSWRGMEGAIAAAKAGNYSVICPTSHSYLDYYQDRPENKEPFAIGGFIPLEKTYSLDPYNGIEPQYRKYILGVQGNLWREYIKTMDHTYYMILPRLAAIAETGWANDRKDFEGFVDRLSTLRLLYDIYGYNYGKHIWEGGGRIK